MSGTMRKMGVYLGLLEDGDADYLDDRYDESARAQREARPAREAAPRQRPRAEARPEPRDVELTGEVADLSERRRAVAPVPARPAAPSVAAHPLSRIVTLHPRTYNEARVIGENYRDGVPVIMNLSEMSDADAKRLVDFAAGLIFAVRGSIDRVTNKVFLLSPPDVTVSAEDKLRIAEGGFFNQS